VDGTNAGGDARCRAAPDLKLRERL